MISEKGKLLCTQSLGRALVVITKNYWGALSKKLEYLGIDRHFSTMVAIDKAQQKCTQQYLCNFLNIDKVAMVRQLDYLVNKGVVKRTINPDDRREHLVQFTSKGQKIIPEIHNGINEFNKIALNGFSKQEQDLFRSYLEKIIFNLHSLPVNEIDIHLKK